MTTRIFLVVLMASLMTSTKAQIGQWTTVRFGNLECDFPKGYSPIQFTGASGVYYEGGSIYLTVTNLPDTSKMKGNLNRDFTNDFMQTVLAVSRKLQGRIREFRDTVIGNMPGYISKMETSPKEGQKSYYELLQVLGQDTLRSFSSQYFVDDEKALKATQRFFGSVHLSSSRPSRGAGQGKFAIWGGVIVVVAVAAVFARKWTTMNKNTVKKPMSKKPRVKGK